MLLLSPDANTVSTLVPRRLESGLGLQIRTSFVSVSKRTDFVSFIFLVHSDDAAISAASVTAAGRAALLPGTRKTSVAYRCFVSQKLWEPC